MPEIPDSDASVFVEQRDGLAIITLNRAERRNGVTVEMCEALYRVVLEVQQGDARVVILRGAGNDFCVGADILAASGSTKPPSAEDLGPIHHSATILHTMPQVTIAAIDGGCAGAGIGWAAACDLRFASNRAKFSTAFLNVGVSGDMGLPWSLERIVGGARSREMLFFPDKFDAAQALAFGFVTRRFPPKILHAETLALARQLCERDPFALRMMKANCLSAETLPMGKYIDIETERHLQTTNRPDMAARMASNWKKPKDGSR
jgi:2-(1,2-epoxy-1,2-dihydrophenyl)acetyl-CoA isomerase